MSCWPSRETQPVGGREVPNLALIPRILNDGMWHSHDDYYLK